MDVLLKILPDILRNVILQLSNEFDSHDVISELNKSYPSVYSELKARYTGRGDERTADSVIAQTLGRNAYSLNITKTGEVKDSENVNGNETPNHCWKKEI